MKPLKNWITTDHGILVPTSEHAYQANKFLDPTAHKVVANARFYNASNKPTFADGYVCKEITKALIECGVAVRSDLEEVKTDMMLAVVRMKFNLNPDLAKRLIATGDELIVEGNDWGDRFWGVDPIGSEYGQNTLGKILMQVRSELQVAN